jgi:UDP-N-acetyl-D-galactosamine dehydrogenase
MIQGKPVEVAREYNLTTTKSLPSERFDAVILGVAHTVL